MELLYKKEKSRLNDAIRHMESALAHDMATIERLKKQEVNQEFNKRKIEKLKITNREKQIELQTLEARLRDLERGYLDEELEEQHEKMQAEIKRKNALTYQRKAKTKELDEEKSALAKEQYHAQRSEERQRRYDEKQMDKALDFYIRDINALPEFMRKKLKKMPNNKGYIWKGIYFYGEMDEEPNQPTVLFEKRRNNLMVIHEWVGEHYKVWHKDGKARKKLQSCVPRHAKATGSTTLSGFIGLS